MKTRFRFHLLPLLTLLGLLAGCSVNPVTGEKQLSIIPESQELAMGAQQYAPTQQIQGGKFYLDPELTLYVSEVGQKLAAVSDRPDLPYEFVVLNSSIPNAWALPGGKIAINRGLLVRFQDEAQLASVIGHEIVHAAARHGVQRIQQTMLINAGVSGLGMALSDNDFADLIMGGAALGSQVALAQYSQSNELESDHYGIRYMVKAGYDPRAAVELQQIFLKLSEDRRTGFVEGLFASHPPSEKRVEENEKLARKLGTGNGYRGRETYQKKLAYLRSVQPAYDAQDEAMKLMRENNPEAALAKINEAIRIEPNEAAFHAVRGQIYSKRGNETGARTEFDKAVSLYPEMFSYRLQRGLNALNLNNLDQARTDLTEANQVVPTSIAYLRLGDIALMQSRRDNAISFYQEAAKSQGEIAAEAKRKLAALLPSPPPAEQQQ